MNSEERRRRAAGRFQPVRQLKERHAGRFDPVQGTGGFEKKGKMKRLEVSMRYQKFHNITSSGDSGLKKIPCKRLECEGMLINIGPTPKRAETKLQRAKERMMSLTRGKNLAFTHSCCFTCNVCADKPTPKHSWQRWCALCDGTRFRFFSSLSLSLSLSTTSTDSHTHLHTQNTQRSIATTDFSLIMVEIKDEERSVRLRNALCNTSRIFGIFTSRVYGRIRIRKNKMLFVVVKHFLWKRSGSSLHLHFLMQTCEVGSVR